MTRPDPLDFFEKLGRDPPDQEQPDDKLIDPGEEALAGLSIGASLAATVGPSLGKVILNQMSAAKDIPWGAHSFGAHSTIADTLKTLQQTVPDLPPPKEKKLLGLIPISERPKQTDNLRRSVRELERIQPEVDSFIRKHKLREKGVSIKFKEGFLSGGPYYDTVSKQVVSPMVNRKRVLHELGHAADFTGTRRGKVWGQMRTPFQAAMLTALPLSLIAGDEIKKALPGTFDDKAIEFMQQNAPSLMGATLAATQLYPEAKANYLALKHIKEQRGPAAAKALAKKLLPNWGTYALSTIAPMIGMAMARKYYNEAKKGSLEKEGSLAESIAPHLRGLLELGKDVGHVAAQIGRGTKQLLKDPQRNQRIREAAKEVGASREFITGALYAGVPATIATGYLYGKRHGPEVREKYKKVDPQTLDEMLATGSRVMDGAKKRIPEEWKERNPGLYASLVGAGAAFSGGIVSKLMADLRHAL